MIRMNLVHITFKVLPDNTVNFYGDERVNVNSQEAG